MRYEDLIKPCPLAIGTRIRLDHMPSDPDPIPAGTTGTVTGGNGGQIFVDWDIDRSLILLPTDRYTVISTP